MSSDRLDVDYSERAGFLTGKSEAIQRWRVKKENEAFAKLVNRLSVTRWYKTVRAEGGQRLANMKASKRRCWLKHRLRYLEAQRLRSRKAPRSRVCEQCGDTFELPYPHPRGSVAKLCGDECRRLYRNAKARGHNASARVRRGKAVGCNMCGACGKLGHNRRTCPSNAIGNVEHKERGSS